MSSELPQAGSAGGPPISGAAPSAAAADPSRRDDRPNPSASPSGAPRGTGARDPRLLARLFESLPPHAIEAEMSLLGSILIEPQCLGDVIFVVKRGEDFFKPAHGAIFDAMVGLYDRHASLDIVQLHQMLLDRNLLEAVGGLDYLTQLALAVPSAANAQHYARLVREKAMVRQLIGAAGDILYDAHHSPEDARTILDQAESKIFNIALSVEQGTVESLATLVNEEVRRYEAVERGQLTGLPSGFHHLDEMTTGFQKSEMLIIAARPSMGKTALALNMAESMATRGVRVGFFSLEMSKQQLVQRMLCARAEIESQKLRRGMLNKEEFRRLCVACGDLQETPVFVDDTPGLTLMQMRTKARRMVSKHSIQVVFVDYLQLLSTGKRTESRQVEVSEISRGVKAMARELNLPVICLSQLNRGPEDRVGNRPRMSDLRESGSLEQDADVVMLLHREDYYHKDDQDWVADNPDLVGVAELILTKQRNGPTGVVKMSWIAQSTRFKDYSDARVPGGMSIGGGMGGGMRAAGGNSGGSGGVVAASTFEAKMGTAIPSSVPSSSPSTIDDDTEPPFAADAPSGAAGGAGGAFAGRSKTGPVDNFRDGGGPEIGDEDEFEGLPI